MLNNHFEDFLVDEFGFKRQDIEISNRLKSYSACVTTTVKVNGDFLFEIVINSAIRDRESLYNKVREMVYENPVYKLYFLGL